MKKSKAIIDFSDYKAAALGAVARVILERMTENGTSFPTSPVTMADLRILVDGYDERLAARAGRATVDVIAYRAKRKELEAALGTLGNYVNATAKGDPVRVEQSGFPSYTTGRVADPSPPAAPTNLRLIRGTLPGTMVVRYKPPFRASANEVETTTGDPTEEASWVRYGVFPRGRADLSGFTPGALVWVRVRTMGLKGVMGAWSDPAQLRVG